MNRHPNESEESLETDPLWKLLEQAPAAKAGPTFATDTVRLARLAGQSEAWWKRLLKPTPIAGLAVATAAVVMAFTLVTDTAPSLKPSHRVAYDSPQANTIQDIAETEVLMVAADNLNEFSDQELVCLIGF